jgi:spermidine/putrescine transport system substrate-binding protein
MRKFITMFVGAMLCAAAVHAQENKLNLFIWSEYIDPQIIKDFEKEFSCKVTVDLYEDNESMMAKLEGGGVSIYDIVVPSDYIIQPLVKRKLIQPLRHDKIPNMANIDDDFRNPSFDTGNKYTAPYQWGTVGIYIRKPKGTEIEETWGLVFDPKKAPGPFLMIDDSRAMIGAALKYLGYSLNSTDKKQLKEARDLLLEAKGRSKGFAGGVDGKNRVLAHGVTMAIVYNGDAVRGTGEDAETVFFVPKEGGDVWLDNMCIPAKAPNLEMAEKFINYILDAKVGAKLSNFNQYATPNKASKPMIKPEDLKNPAIYPPPTIMKKLEYLNDLGPHNRLYDEVWTFVKSK